MSRDARPRRARPVVANNTRPLPASAFGAGDRVVGEDAGGTHHGVIQETPKRHVDAGNVLVRWADEDYDDTTRGHLVPADMILLWPARAHAARLRTRQVGVRP